MVVSKNRNDGNAGEPSGNWCLGPSTGALAESSSISPRKKIEIVYAKFCILVHFLNTSTIGTAFPIEMIPDWR